MLHAHRQTSAAGTRPHQHYRDTQRCYTHTDRHLQLVPDLTNTIVIHRDATRTQTDICSWYRASLAKQLFYVVQFQVLSLLLTRI